MRGFVTRSASRVAKASPSPKAAAIAQLLAMFDNMPPGPIEIVLLRGKQERSRLFDDPVEAATWAIASQPEGFNCYVRTARLRDRCERPGRKENMLAGRAFRLDCDAKAGAWSPEVFEQLDPPPTMLIETSPSSYHAYWLTDGYFDLQEERE